MAWTLQPRSSYISWGNNRVGGAYLTNSLGEYILTKAGEKIIVKIPGGTLNVEIWQGRIIPN